LFQEKKKKTEQKKLIVVPSTTHGIVFFGFDYSKSKWEIKKEKKRNNIKLKN